MTQNLRRLLYLLISLIIILLGCTSPEIKQKPPMAEKGVLDLREWDFNKHGSVDLDGEWRFYWKQLKHSGKTFDSELEDEAHFFKFPSIWNNQIINGESLSGDGFATFSLKILLKDQKIPLTVNIHEMMTAYTFYVDGKKISSNGLVGTSRGTSVPMYHPSLVDIRTSGTEMNIDIEVSNFHHRKGGVANSIKLGLESDIRSDKEFHIVIEIFLIGSIFFMGLYHLTMYLLRRKELSALYFGLFACLITLRTSLTGERFLINLFSGLGWEILHKFEYLTFYLALPLFVMFIRSLFPDETPKIVLRLVQVAGIVFSAIVIATPARLYSHLLQGYQIITLLTGLVIIFILVKAWLRKRDGALIFIASFPILFLSAVNDILYANELLHGGFFIALGLFVFMFSQSFLLSSRSAQNFSVIENQKDLLAKTNIAFKKEIDERKKLEVDLDESQQNFMDSRVATILGLAKLAEYRDSDTGLHLERMREYSRLLASELANHPKYREYITQEYIDDIYLSSILHDIGKVGIPDSILLKPGKLDFDEFNIMKGHSNLGGEAISTVEEQVKIRSFLTLGRDIAYHHHEKWDGSGYPFQLTAEKIPLSARIVAVADVYDALTSLRPYKKAFPHEKAVEIILGEKGTHFDPDLVDLFMDLSTQFDKVRGNMQDSL
jgi:adenylate cyclase